MYNFVYLAQRRSQEFSCEPNFGGGASPFDPLPGCASDLEEQFSALAELPALADLACTA